MARSMMNSRYAFAFALGTLPCHILAIISSLLFECKLGWVICKCGPGDTLAWREHVQPASIPLMGTGRISILCIFFAICLNQLVIQFGRWFPSRDRSPFENDDIISAFKMDGNMGVRFY